MNLAEFTSPALIEPRLEGTDSAAALLELSGLLARAGLVSDPLQLGHEALNRTFLLSTDPASHLVLPYAQLAAVPRPVFAFGRSPRAIDWRPRRRAPVHLVLLTALPSMDAPEYFALAAGLIQLISDPSQLRRLRCAGDTRSILGVFTSIEIARRHPESVLAAH